MPFRHAATLVLATLAATSSAPVQAGLVGVFGGPVWLEAGSRSEYLHIASGTNAVRSDTPLRTVVLQPWRPGFPADGGFEAMASTELYMSGLPGGSGDFKDRANGNAAVQYTVGAGTADDHFQFSFTGDLSNVNSKLAPDKPADTASVQLRGLLHVEVSPNGGIGTGARLGDRIGSLTLDALRAAQAYEAFSVTVWELRPGRTELATRLPGSGSFSFDLQYGGNYEVQLDYTMQVPFGTDPPISLQLGGSISAVPEPAPAALLAAGLLALALRRRQPAG